MEPQTAELCAFCSGLIPPKDEPLPSRAHYENIGRLEQSSRNCSICKTLLGNWSLENTRKRFPDIDKGTYKSIPLKVKLKEFQNSSYGLSWAILEAHFCIRECNFLDSFSITACKSNCRLSLFRLLEFQ
jgi:hypothetical protein